jgi:hypothetical protein
MAKANGIIQIEGTVDQLTFFKLNGKSYVRQKGGVSKERIASDPNYVRTRENNNEFSLCTASAKLLRLSLGSLVFKAKDSRLSSRLLQRMYRIKNFDTISARGQRLVSNGLGTAEGKQELVGFNFNIKAPLQGVLFAPYTLDTVHGEIIIANLLPMEQLLFPQGATNVSLQGAVLALDFETAVSELVLSNIVNLPIDMTLSTVTLTPPSMPVSTSGVTLFLLTIAFYQEVNGVQYSLKNEDYNVLNVLEVV